MSEQLPAPDFDAQNYARPNQNWICGHACNGNACRQGPDAKGRCCATTECKPVLKKNLGETKGRWHCTRVGGECESGPLPDGNCCRPITKCSPVPTLRLIRGRVTVSIIAVSCAVLLVVLGNPLWRNNFISPGEISSPHLGAAFAALAVTNHFNQTCGACHMAGSSGPYGIMQAALQAQPGILDLKRLARTEQQPEMTAIDESCLKCHAGKNFHHPDAAIISCSFCHAEHQGKLMAATTDANCSFCHGQPVKALSARVENEVTRLLIKPPQNSSSLMSSGFIHHFATDHPQFRVIAEKWRDPDTLKFNHALHLTGAAIPKLPGGQKMDCAFCHQADAAGAFMKPVAFEQNCRVCHSLQFDPETPQLQLPHGSVEFVSAYLRSLPKQYLGAAAAENAADASGFVEKKLAGLRTQFGSGEELEHRIFLSGKTTAPEMQVGMVRGTTRAVFPGCAYCHEVKSAPNSSPKITPPLMLGRWLTQAKFDHAKHANISCAQCHDAVHSRDTADILLPAQETCVACHSPQGGVASSCTQCHSYHQPCPVGRRF